MAQTSKVDVKVPGLGKRQPMLDPNQGPFSAAPSCLSSQGPLPGSRGARGRLWIPATDLGEGGSGGTGTGGGKALIFTPTPTASSAALQRPLIPHGSALVSAGAPSDSQGQAHVLETGRGATHALWCPDSHRNKDSRFGKPLSCAPHLLGRICL